MCRFRFFRFPTIGIPGEYSASFGSHHYVPMYQAVGLEKREKREKLESCDEDGQVTKVELLSGEEGVSSKSSASSRIMVIRYVCPRENESTESVSEKKAPEVYRAETKGRDLSPNPTTRRRHRYRPPRSPRRHRPGKSGRRRASRGRRTRPHFPKHRDRTRAIDNRRRSKPHQRYRLSHDKTNTSQTCI